MPLKTRLKINIAELGHRFSSDKFPVEAIAYVFGRMIVRAQVKQKDIFGIVLATQTFEIPRLAGIGVRRRTADWGRRNHAEPGSSRGGVSR